MAAVVEGASVGCTAAVVEGIFDATVGVSDESAIVGGTTVFAVIDGGNTVADCGVWVATGVGKAIDTGVVAGADICSDVQATQVVINSAAAKPIIILL